MLFPTLRDRGDEILKGLLFMTWLPMATADAIPWAPAEENSFLGWLKHGDVAGREREAGGVLAGIDPSTPGSRCHWVRQPQPRTISAAS